MYIYIHKKYKGRKERGAQVLVISYQFTMRDVKFVQLFNYDLFMAIK